MTYHHLTDAIMEQLSTDWVTEAKLAECLRGWPLTDIRSQLAKLASERRIWRSTEVEHGKWIKRYCLPHGVVDVLIGERVEARR